MKQKLFITVLLAFIGFNNLMAQAPDYSWAQSFGGTGGSSGEIAEATCTDASGNIYTTGWFTSTTLTIGTTTLTKVGISANFLLIKLDATGTVLWAKSLGTVGSQIRGKSICTDASGNVIVAGIFGPLPITIGTTILTPTGTNNDVFIAKYDAAGNVIWAKKEGNTGVEDGFVSADASGNIYLAMNSTSSTITIGGQTFINFEDPKSDIYIVKYNASGTVVWVRHDGGIQSDNVADISTDAVGNTYITGKFAAYDASATINFSPLSIAGSPGASVMVVVKYDASGIAEWVSKGAIGSEQATGICTDNNGTIAVTGSFSGTTLELGGITIPNPHLGATEIFTASYDAFGNAAFLKSEGGAGFDYGHKVAIDANGNILVVGVHASPTITIGTSAFTNTDVTGLISNDIVLFKYDPTGNIIWADVVGGNLDDTPTGLFVDVAISPTGDEVISGMFSSTTIAVGSTTLTNAAPGVGSADLFLATIVGEPAIFWTGNTSSNWFTATNWNPAQIPTLDDNVSISEGRPNYPVIASGSAKCKKFTIAIGALFTMTGGTMNVYGAIKATDQALFHLTGGTLNLYHGSKFPIDMTFNNLTLINNNDVVADNIYEMPTAAFFNGNLKLTGSISGVNPLLPKLNLKEDNNLFLYKNLVVDKGFIGISAGELPLADNSNIPNIVFEGTAAQNLQLKNYDPLFDAVSLYCNVQINNPLVKLVNTNFNIVFSNLIVNQNFNLAGNSLSISGKIIYNSASLGSLKITNSKPLLGRIEIVNDPTYAYDSDPQYVSVDKLRSLYFFGSGFGGGTNTLTLINPLAVDTLQCLADLDLLGNNLTIGATTRSTGYLNCSNIITTYGAGTVSLLGNASCPRYTLIADKLNNLTVNNPAGVEINNDNGVLGYPSMELYGTAKLTAGNCDLKNTAMTLKPDFLLSQVNLGKIIETPGNTFYKSTTSSALLGSISIDTIVTTPVTNINYGGLGFVISCNNPLNQLFISRISRTSTGVNGGTSINKDYIIENPGAGTNLNAKIKIKYDDSQLQGVN